MPDFSDLSVHPISRVEWVDVNTLTANSYNPNVVLGQEMRLLKLSLMVQGWIQPVLVNQSAQDEGYEIIDGYHRYTLVKTDPEVNLLTRGMVPVVLMHLSRPESMMLTIRINRAKGNHVAVKMHDIVYELHYTHSLPIEDICRGVGADKHEIDTLLMEDIFKKKDVANVPYSKAWVPKRNRATKKA